MLTRRQFAARAAGVAVAPLVLEATGLWSGAAFAEQAPVAFDWGELVRRVDALATADYQPPPETLPQPLADLDYDRFRDLRFRADRAIWRGPKLPFHTQTFN